MMMEHARLIACASALLACSPGSSASAQQLDVKDLPLTEVPSRTRGGHVLAFFLSGDGGWAALPRDISRVLADSGISVIGLDSRAYLDHRRQPDELAADSRRVLENYMKRWRKDRIMLVGYSRGAEFVPFIANRLRGELRARIDLAVLIAPGERASFEFHWVDIVRTRSRSTDTAILPEIRQMHGIPTICMYGRDEVESLCRSVDAKRVQVVERAGQHHLDKDYGTLAQIILQAAATLPQPASGQQGAVDERSSPRAGFIPSTVRAPQK